MPERDLHPPDQAPFQAHECGDLWPLCRELARGAHKASPTLEEPARTFDLRTHRRTPNLRARSRTIGQFYSAKLQNHVKKRARFEPIRALWGRGFVLS